jgi:Antibiotic biosynthesis monooxygenase
VSFLTLFFTERDMNQPLNILAIATAVNGSEHRLRAAQEILVAETVKEPGCLRYELSQSLDDGRILVFVESWQAKKPGGLTCREPQSNASRRVERRT